MNWSCRRQKNTPQYIQLPSYLAQSVSTEQSIFFVDENHAPSECDWPIKWIKHHHPCCIFLLEQYTAPINAYIYLLSTLGHILGHIPFKPQGASLCIGFPFQKLQILGNAPVMKGGRSTSDHSSVQRCLVQLLSPSQSPLFQLVEPGTWWDKTWKI